MKNYFWILVLTFLAACGQEPKDPAAELAELKKQALEINAKIADLEKEVGASGAAHRVRKIGFDEVTPAVFEHYIDIQGRVDAEDNVAVTSKMPGTLQKIHVKNGSYVKKGQIIATLDDNILNKNMTELQTQLTTAEDIFQRQKQLWDQKIGTEVQFIQARTQVEALKNSMETLRAQMGNANITAPISGTVDMVNMKVGQAMSPGFPFCQIVNLGDLKIKSSVPESYISLVKKGASVKVYFPDLDKEVMSKVTYVGQTIDPASRTFQLECSLPNGKDFRPNMIAVLRITDYKNNKAVVIPVNVIQTDERGQFVLVAEKKGETEAIVKKVIVEKGKNYNGKVEITSGLTAGDLVIVTGWQEVNPNETVSF